MPTNKMVWENGGDSLWEEGDPVTGYEYIAAIEHEGRIYRVAGDPKDSSQPLNPDSEARQADGFIVTVEFHIAMDVQEKKADEIMRDLCFYATGRGIYMVHKVIELKKVVP